MNAGTGTKAKWQPIMLLLSGGRGRLECECGALAIFVIGVLRDDDGLKDAQYYCQPCYLKLQNEEDERLKRQGE